MEKTKTYPSKINDFNDYFCDLSSNFNNPLNYLQQERQNDTSTYEDLTEASLKMTDNNIINKIINRKKERTHEFFLEVSNVEKVISKNHLEEYKNLIQNLINEQFITQDAKYWTRSLSLFVVFVDYVNKHFVRKRYKDRKKIHQVYYWTAFAKDFSLIANGEVKPITAQSLYRTYDRNLSKNYIDGEDELKEIMKQ